MNNEKQIINSIDAFYEILSGPKSSSRDWSKFKELFFQNATLCPHKKANNGFNSEIFGIEEYIERLKKFLTDNDFYEFGVNYKMNIYGNICSVYNVYQAFSDHNRNNFIKEGINLINLLYNGREWKIINMLWEDK